MANVPLKLLVAAALIATGACAKKRPPVLPPAPGENVDGAGEGAGAGAGAGAGSGGFGNEGSGGLREQFRSAVASDTVNFALDSFDIDGPARAILDSQVQWLAAHPQVRVTVEGHCDERGTREYNLALGERRANAAANYLVSRGLATSRITTISYGKERPLALGSDDNSWAQNRRAVTVVLQ